MFNLLDSSTNIKLGEEMWIMQMSDIHSCINFTHAETTQILKSIVHIIKEQCGDNEVIFVVCGDIINRGDENGYERANLFITELLQSISTEKKHLITCPGNHDIIAKKSKPFVKYNKFIYELTRNSKLLFNRNSVCVIDIDDILFYIINSVYHGDYTFGQVNLDELNTTLSEAKDDKFKVFILHHHLIPLNRGDSMIVNSYGLIKLAIKYKVNLILHGHRHMNLHININMQSCNVIGVGTITSKTGSNINNQFNLLHIVDGFVDSRFSYKLISDQSSNGNQYSFTLM